MAAFLDIEAADDLNGAEDQGIVQVPVDPDPAEVYYNPGGILVEQNVEHDGPDAEAVVEEAEGKEDEGKQPEEHKFRFSGKSLAVTYPRTEEGYNGLPALTKEHCYDYYMCKFSGYGVYQFVCGEENHVGEQGKHIHLGIVINNKFDTRDARFLDIRGHHPFIKSIKKGRGEANWNAWFSYCTKQDKQFLYVMPVPRLVVNFVKRKADYDAFCDCYLGAPKEFPAEGILYPDGLSMWSPPGKKKHLLVVGVPDWGKSAWAIDSFAVKHADLVYMFNAMDQSSMFEHYRLEPIIFVEELGEKEIPLTVLNNMLFAPGKCKRACSGKQRYGALILPGGFAAKLWVTLANRIPFYGVLQDAFLARTHIVDTRVWIHPQYPRLEQVQAAYPEYFSHE